MAEQPIQIEVQFEGAEQAARELGRVSNSVDQVGRTANAAGTSVESFARGFQNTAQRIQGVAGAVQSLATALGSESRAGSMVASVAGATAQFAAMGAMLGPGGAVIGGIFGLTTSVLALRDAHVSAAEAAATERQRIMELADARIAERDAAARAEAISSGAFGGISEEELTREREARVVRREELNTEFRELRERARAAREMYEGAGREVPEAISRPILARIRELRSEFSSLGEEAAAITGELSERAGSLGGAPEATRRRGGGGRRAAAPVEAAAPEVEARLDSMRFFAEAELEITEDTNDRLIEMREERDARMAAKAEEAAQLEIDIAKRQYEEMQRLGEEQEQERMAADERAIENRQEMMGELGGLMAQTTMMMGKSIAAVATGEQTAEKAFEGMAKAFLEMIAQYAAMKAATEFADAIASFARYDYSGGAQHIAAGVAFTAVAVATGVGAAAIGSAPSAPARPETGGPAEGGAGGDVIINWNSPVITAGTQAELGRELQAAVSAAGSI